VWRPGTLRGFGAKIQKVTVTWQNPPGALRGRLAGGADIALQNPPGGLPAGACRQQPAGSGSPGKFAGVKLKKLTLTLTLTRGLSDTIA
jgi:hypothetical protein